MVIRSALLLTILPSVLLLKVEEPVPVPYTPNFTTGLLLKDEASVSVPFTHDFATGLHGWYFNPSYWSWTGNPHSLPNTSNVPQFSYTGEIVWTQQNLSDTQSDMAFTLYRVKGVARSTKFTFKYWFSTESSDNSTGLRFYLTDFIVDRPLPPIKTITSSDDKWNEFTIDCDKDDCCLTDRCNLEIQIIGYVGYAKDYGIAAISSVSAYNSGPTLKSSHTLMAIAFLVLALFIIRPANS